MDQFAMWLGYVWMASGGVAVTAGLIVLAAMASNKAQHEAVRSLGGWKLFLEFRDWKNGSESN